MYIASEQRYLYFDVLRVIAIFSVIILHVSAQNYYSSFPSYEWEVRNFYDSLSRWGVPVFVMISGALFLDKKKSFSIKKLYKKNIIHIVSALLFWSFFYQLYISDKDTTYLIFFKGIIKGPTHLWFLKMLLGLYIIIPILRIITSNKRIEIYFLCIAFITNFIIPFVLKIINTYDYQLYISANKQLDLINLKIGFGFVGYFVWGHFLHTYKLRSAIKKMIFLGGILSFICVILCTSYISHYINHPSTFLYSNMSVFTLLESTTIFIIVCDRYKNNNTISFNNVIFKISNLTFGIYLVHYLIIWVLRDSFNIIFSKNISILIPVYSLLIFFISLLITYLLSKIPVIKKYII